MTVTRKLRALPRLASIPANALLHCYDPATGKDYYILYQDLISTGTFPDWDPEAAAAGDYDIGARVNYGFRLWESLVDNNTAIPTEGSNWTEVSPATIISATNPVFGDLLFFDGLAWRNFNLLDVSQFSHFESDMMDENGLPPGLVINTHLNGTNSGTENYGVDGTEKANGVLSLGSGTDAAGYAFATRRGYNVGNGHEIRLRWRAAVEDLSDGTETYLVRFGLAPDGVSLTSSDPDNGIMIKYSHGLNGGKFQAMTRASSTSTLTDSGVTVDTTYKEFEIRINGAAGEVKFFIDDVQVALHTANIPAAGAYTMSLGIWKTVGTTTRLLHLDTFADLVFINGGR